MKRPWTDEPAPLDASLRGLVEADKQVAVPSELRDRVLRRARGTGLWRSPRLIDQPRRRWSRARAAVAAAVVFASGAAVSAAWRIFERRTEPAIVTSVLPSTEGSASRAVVVPKFVEAEAVPDAEEPRSIRHRPVAAGTRSEGAADPAEVAILDRARASIAGGDFARALPPLAEHARRFPRGRLAEEREALRVKALSALGRAEEARRAATAFRARFPGSVLQPRVDELAPAGH